MLHAPNLSPAPQTYLSTLRAARDLAVGEEREVLSVMLASNHVLLQERMDPDEDFDLPDDLRDAAELMAQEMERMLGGRL